MSDEDVNAHGEVVVELAASENHGHLHHSTVPVGFLIERLQEALESNSTAIFLMISEPSAERVRGYWVNADDARKVFRIAPVVEQSPLFR